ncbi:amidase domain-containing protein [Clostridia bacterium]|nr:amidase domain-containing protein [Clostridia bacterium]
MKKNNAIYRMLALLGLSICLCTSCTLKVSDETSIQNGDNDEIALRANNEQQKIVFANLGTISMPKAVELLIRDFTLDYYSSFVDYQEANLLSYFDLEYEASAQNAYINQLALSYLLAVRKGQESDLRLNYYECILEIIEATEMGNNLLRVVLLEHSQIRYSFIPERTTYASGIKHEFLVQKTDDEWKILIHTKQEDVYYVAEKGFTSEFKKDEATETLDVSEEEFNWDIDKEKIVNLALLDERYSKVLGLLVLDANESIHNNVAAYEQYLEGTSEFSDLEPVWENEYDREKAVEYAYEWTGCCGLLRNPVWKAYDELGGNCNNFISQCLYAGGIPMDITGSINNQWKWYGDCLDEKERHSGRSSSWSGVDEFYEYAMNNEGPGLVAIVGDNIYSGQIGDVIQYGTDGKWTHSVIIVDVIRDENDMLVDYLVNSNTTDRIDCPMSAYSYADIRLIKIVGYNTEQGRTEEEPS